MLKTGKLIRKNDGLRPVQPEDIVILMRAPGSRTSVYAAALAEQGVSCAVEDNEDFFATMEISTVLSLLKVVDNPRQDVPLIAVLRSPLFAFSPHHTRLGCGLISAEVSFLVLELAKIRCSCCNAGEAASC